MDDVRRDNSDDGFRLKAKGQGASVSWAATFWDLEAQKRPGSTEDENHEDSSIEDRRKRVESEKEPAEETERYGRRQQKVEVKIF